MEKFGKLIVWLLLFLLSIFAMVTVVMFMWSWFFVPLGLSKPNFWLTFGAILTIRLICGGWRKSEGSKKYSEQIFDFISNILMFLLIWGIGALVYLGV